MQAPYRLIEALLLEQSARLGLTPPVEAAVDESLAALDAPLPAQPLPFSSIFAVGDNPAAGAISIRGSEAAYSLRS